MPRTVARRSGVLRAVVDGPATKPDLDEALPVSRSTIDRSLRELEDAALVTRDDGGYRGTLAGRLALAEHDRYRQRLDGLDDAASLLSTVDPDADLDPAMFADARVVESTRASPQRPIEALYDHVERATRVKGFAPAVHPQQVETYHEQVVEEGMAIDIVVTAEALERLVTDYGGRFEEAMALDRVSFWEAAGQLPYSVTVAETPEGALAGLLVNAADGIRGCVMNDDPAAVAWAERRFERERAAATPVGQHSA